jgi:hypothetical protein
MTAASGAPNYLTRQEVSDRLARAVARLLANDRHLLMVDANERAITHRLAVLLEPEFPGWDVDCEYNRDLGEVKELELPERDRATPGVMRSRPVLPDIIVHHRNTEENLLVIEARKAGAQNRGVDQREKLQAFVQQLGYAHAVFLVIDGPRITLEFVESAKL